MGKQIDNAMAKIKLWQEECKLVLLFVSAVTAVATFVTKVFYVGKFIEVPMKSAASAMAGESNRDVAMEIIKQADKSTSNTIFSALAIYGLDVLLSACLI